MNGIFRMLFLAASAYAAYKAGEKNAQLKAVSFFVSIEVEQQPGVKITQYVTISPAGLIGYTQDRNQASAFYLPQASELKKMIQQYAPAAEIHLLTSENLMLSQ